ncbi:Hpt domain-containing protein [Gemmata sp.]|uniref:hybrid sensor histidine kinase/response regulator n=1 Tax=Gemmata sp. TaxID=1914242 RepID=UPI003F71F4C1
MSPLAREIMLGFVAEANSYLPAIEAGFAEYRADPARPGTLEEAHRCVHTIKGASAMVGLPELSHVAFHLEEMVEQLLHEPGEASPALVDGVHVAVGFIRRYLEGVEAGQAAQPALAAEALRHVRGLRGLPEEEAPPGVPEPALQVGPAPAPSAGPDDALDLPLPDFSAGPPVAGPEDLALPDNLFDEPGDREPPPPRSEAAPWEVVAAFRAEAEEHVRTLATLLPEARNDLTNRERWDAIRRAAHTLKGSAGLAGFGRVTQLAHRMEDLLDLYHDAGRAATPVEVDLLLAGADLIADEIEGRAGGERFAAALAQLDGVLGSAGEASAAVPGAGAGAAPAAAPAPAPEDAGRFVRVPIERLDEVSRLVGELVIARTTLEQKVAHLSHALAEARPSVDRLGRVSNRIEVGYEASALVGGGGAAVEPEAGPGGPDGGDERFDELELDRYTVFHLLTRELAETTADVQAVHGEFGHLLGDVDGELSRQARLASQIEEHLMHLRTVPLATVSARLHRTVRTAAAAAGKVANFVLQGEQTGLDKTVLEALADPLLHLLRNAVDHGLEAPEVRVAVGKAAAGTVTLRAAREGAHVVLGLSDDGAGIDYAAVRAAAVAKGLASPEEVAAASDDEAAEFLFRPGFTTRGEVSELSGRGIGLDVVKTRIEALKGTVAVASAAGRGTTFTVRLPMTLAVVRALLVRAGGQVYAIPLEAVQQILRPSDDELDRFGRDPVLRVGGAVHPLVPLVRALRAGGSEGSDPRAPVVVVSAAGKRVALRVDQLLGGREVVVKPLGRPHKRLHGVSGATFLGDGSVVLILNPAELVRGTGAGGWARPAGAAQAARSREGSRVLVVDDSPSVRRVLTLLLRGAGWQVVVAKDGVEALEVLHRGTDLPDVVLTDVEMPRMDGYELLSTVRREAALSHLPVAILTSRSADKHRRKGLDLGASAYVVKPYQDRHLLDVLHQLMRAGHQAPTA